MNKIWQYFLVNKERLAELLYSEWKLISLEWMGVDNWDGYFEAECEYEDDILERLTNNDWLRIWQSIANKLYEVVKYDKCATDPISYALWVNEHKAMLVDKLHNISDDDFIKLFN